MWIVFPEQSPCEQCLECSSHSRSTELREHLQHLHLDLHQGSDHSSFPSASVFHANFVSWAQIFIVALMSHCETPLESSGPGFWNLRAAKNLNLGNDALDLQEFRVCWHKTVVISCLLIYLFSIGKLQIRSTGNISLTAPDTCCTD